jgi:hypothetical protein
MDNYDELKKEVECLLRLLEDPHPGIMTWNQMVHKRRVKIAEWGDED